MPINNPALSHIAVRVDGSILKGFCNDDQGLTINDVERYFTNCIQHEIILDDATLGIRLNPCITELIQHVLVGYMQKTNSFQSISDQLPEHLPQDLAIEMLHVINNIAHVSDMHSHYNLLDTYTHKNNMVLDGYIFLELLLQRLNSETSNYRVDSEYLTAINPNLSSRYIYFNDNKNKVICRFISKNPNLNHLKSFLKEMHFIKIDSEQFFYSEVLNGGLKFDQNYAEFCKINEPKIKHLVAAYKLLVLNRFKFDIYDFIEDDFDLVVKNRILKGMEYAHCISKRREPSTCLVSVPEVKKLL